MLFLACHHDLCARHALPQVAQSSCRAISHALPKSSPAASRFSMPKAVVSMTILDSFGLRKPPLILEVGTRDPGPGRRVTCVIATARGHDSVLPTAYSGLHIVSPRKVDGGILMTRGCGRHTTNTIYSPGRRHGGTWTEPRCSAQNRIPHSALRQLCGPLTP